jgi:sarcosine oxidase subunit alpha
MSERAMSLPPGVLTDSKYPITFQFEGRTIPALHGQSVAAALYAAGVRVFTRSFKYHRPRGLFCVSGECPNCLMNVDGRPNVRTCIEPARQGQTVTHQNAWPSLDFDALRVFDKLDRFLAVGFYYKRFHRPRWLWPIFEHTVRHVAGLGRVELEKALLDHAEVEHVHADVCVIGGGPAGMAAAKAAKAGGAVVVLLERESFLGGHLAYHKPVGWVESARPNALSVGLEDSTHPTLDGLEKASGPGRITVHPGTNVFGLYEGNLVGAFQGERLLKIRAKQIIVATGGRQQPFLFPNNDLPGIMLGNGVLRLARLHGVLAGKRAVVLTDCDDGVELADQLTQLGIEVPLVIYRRSAHRECAQGNGPYTVVSGAVLRANGNKRLKSALVARGASNLIENIETVRCDLLCLASELVPANELLLMAGVRFRRDGTRWLPENSVPGILAAGTVAGTFGSDEQARDGQEIGTLAAALARGEATGLPAPRNVRLPAPVLRPIHHMHGSKGFVCLCEDVTDKDIEQAVAEGFDHIETLKRYTTVNMGPCQGKMCGLAAAELCAQWTGRDPNSVGLTTSRPPAVPVEMGVLAADRRHQPIRRTPLHHWHERHGARWMDAGQWKRPESYGDPAAEVRAVRTAVGLIDVGTLGKIEVIGPDAAELLERVYLNKWADLKLGRARYGVMCNEEGIVFDDGVGARVGPDRFYLTATTGNAEGAVQWLDLWRDIWRLNAAIVNHTSAVAAMNLAGPQSRAVLGLLTKLDLSAASFPYMAMREAEVAGVACRLFRIGFVGELGYEIHCPSSQAWHLWNALHAAGKEVAIRAFGVEAQRILRLEKGHFIIGVDTDALSNALDAGLQWLVRFDKPQFHGREPLLRLQGMEPRSRLVGFQLSADEAIPEEGCQVVDRGAPVGRVTSVRLSPTHARFIGLAWVPAARATPGSRFVIRHGGRDIPAMVSALPFYDPDGKRLRI